MQFAIPVLGSVKKKVPVYKGIHRRDAETAERDAESNPLPLRLSLLPLRLCGEPRVLSAVLISCWLTSKKLEFVFLHPP